MGLICTYIFQSFVYSCNVRYSTKKKNKSCQGETERKDVVLYLFFSFKYGNNIQIQYKPS